MNYRTDKYGNKISTLAYGCMRFTQNAGKVDIDKAEKEFMAAYNAGVNYFDTAYIYPGNEQAVGEILKRNNIRDKINLATKLPHYLIKKPGQVDKYFDEQLKRLNTDYINYYLMHMLTDIDTWERLKGLGIEEWIKAKKESGQIKQIGFSYHGNSEMFIKLVDAFDWDFCMIQYNYMDEKTQAGVKGLKHAHEKGLPVMIMEPLRGGRLVNNLPADAKKAFEEYEVKRSPAEWALRWLWNQKEVTTVLSGMNSLEMVKENIRVASDANAGDFTEEDFKLIEKVKKAINASVKVPCTGCRYCMPCPKNVDIPGSFSAYNRLYTDGWYTGMKEYIMCTALRKTSTAANNCIGCGKCEEHCPQKIKIREEIKNVNKKLGGPIYKIVAKGAKLVVKY